MPFDFIAARTKMVDGQVRPNKVNSPSLLDAMQTVPRELYVPLTMQELAYSDQVLDLPTGRCLLQPMVFARMVEALALQPNHRVLDIAPGTGYSTAVIAQLVQAVVALESDNGLSLAAGQLLQTQQVKQAQVVHGPISLGAKQLAPYDAIFVNGAMAEVPRTLFYQLIEGGKLIAVIGGKPGAVPGKVTLFTKLHNTISERVLFEAAVPYVPGFLPTEGFKL